MSKLNVYPCWKFFCSADAPLIWPLWCLGALPQKKNKKKLFFFHHFLKLAHRMLILCWLLFDIVLSQERKWIVHTNSVRLFINCQLWQPELLKQSHPYCELLINIYSDLLSAITLDEILNTEGLIFIFRSQLNSTMTLSLSYYPFSHESHMAANWRKGNRGWV